MKLSSSGWNEGSLLLRFVYMLLFTSLFGLAELVVFALLVIQGFSVIAGGVPNPSVQKFSASFGEYLRQIVTYIGCQRSVKPWPFSDWPEGQVNPGSADREA